MKIHKISSATYLQPGRWVVMVMSMAAISWLESTYFYVGKIITIIDLNGFVSFFLFCS